MLQGLHQDRIDRAISGVGAQATQNVCGAMLDRLDTPIFLIGRESDREGLIYANRAFERWAGCAGAALLGGDWRRLCRLAADDPALTRLQSGLRAGQGGQALVRTHPPGGSPGWAEVRLSPLPAEDGDERFIGQLRDVTAEMNEREVLRRQALYDALTGLPNRRLLRIRLARAIRRARDRCAPFALVYIDLDRFKQVNDSIGHEAADRLLRRVAQRLRHGVRAQDTVARLYGDEFALLLTALTTEQSAEVISDRVAAWLRQPFVIDGQEFSVTCSVGVALYPDGTDGRHLLGSADRDMYRHKRIRHQHLAVIARTSAFPTASP